MKEAKCAQTETCGEDRPAQTLSLTVSENRLPLFFELLAQGISLPLAVGTSIRHVLCDQLGFCGDYLAERIQTIFLDGKAVDDVASAIVRDGATLALSAAMPGVVGATMRRQGRYAVMRQTISHQPADTPAPPQQGWITLKLFNLLASEKGPAFLSQGIAVQGRDLCALLKRQGPDFWSDCRDCRLNGKPVSPQQLLAADLEAGPLTLTVKTQPA
ncbi:MAG: hypothetical protein R6X05_10755 [Desulfobacterales bacterium]|jgi:hypothetical protein